MLLGNCLSHGFGLDGCATLPFAHGYGADLIPLLLVIFGPFILAGLLFIAAIVAFSRNAVVGGVCLLLAFLSFALGAAIFSHYQSPPWARHSSWAGQVGTVTAWTTGTRELHGYSLPHPPSRSSRLGGKNLLRRPGVQSPPPGQFSDLKSPLPAWYERVHSRPWKRPPDVAPGLGTRSARSRPYQANPLKR